MPKHRHLLLGSKFALLRAEFLQWREYSLKRRLNPKLKHLRITMGGVDTENVTLQFLEKLRSCDLPRYLKVTVVLVPAAPHAEEIRCAASNFNYKIEIKTGVNHMAELMANADICIGDAGSTSWERCCLGLPTLMIILADNQKVIARKLEESGSAIVLSLQYIVDLCKPFNLVWQHMESLSHQSIQVADGKGVQRVIEWLK